MATFPNYIDLDIAHRGELMARFCSSKNIRERIEIKREAMEHGYLELVNLMLKKLFPEE